MKILTLADVEDKALWDHLDREYLQSADLILAAGDLKPEYLEFISTFTTSPVLYVRGNHDRTKNKPDPAGCICIEDTVYDFEGIKIVGLGGSIRYKPGLDQYTEDEMKKRIKKLRRKIKKAGGVDILLTHAPGWELGDDKDLPHWGFRCFVSFLDEYKPKYMIHGHVHLNYGRKERVRSYNETTLINAFDKYMFDY